MGTSPTPRGFNFTQYQFLKEIVDPRFGEIKIYQKNETGETICQIEKILSEPAKPFVKLEHPNLLKVYFYQAQTKQELCTSFTKLSIVYEYVNNDLRSIIQNRQHKKIPFTEQQLWALLNQGISVLEFLKQRKIYPMDLKNLMISNQGILKMHSINDNQLTNYQQLFSHYTEEIHLSPEELECLKKRQICPDLDLEKCEIFQFGMTILYAASLADTNSIYSYEQLSYSGSEIKERIAELSYSQQFKSTLTKMLSIQPKERGTFNELAQIISYHDLEEDILSMRKMEKQSLVANSSRTQELPKQEIEQYQYSSFKSEKKQQSNVAQNYNASNYQSGNKQNNSEFIAEIPLQARRLSINSKNQLPHTTKPVITSRISNMKQENNNNTSYQSNNSQRNLRENRVEQAIMKSKLALQKFNQAQSTQQLYGIDKY